MVHHRSTLKFHICIPHTTNFWNYSKETIEHQITPIHEKLK